MDAATAGLAGAAIGVLGSSISTYLQQRLQGQRDRQKMAVDLAMAEYGHDLEKIGKPLVAPLATYVLINVDLLEAIANGNVTPEKVRENTGQTLVMKTLPPARPFCGLGTAGSVDMTRMCPGIKHHLHGHASRNANRTTASRGSSRSSGWSRNHFSTMRATCP